MVRTVAVILAAGMGKRMESDLPKVLHPVNGRPMVAYAIDSAIAATGEKPILIIGHKAEKVRDFVGNQAHFVLQEEQLGTGHAVQQAEGLLSKLYDFVLVLSADMPLLTPKTLQQLITFQLSHSGPISMLTVVADDPHGFGRVIRDEKGQVQQIVEEAVATPAQLRVRELNAGVYCFSGAWLWAALKEIKLSPKGEYYLTDLVEIAVEKKLSVQAITLDDPIEAIGVNTRAHLLEADSLMIQRHSMKI
ncbi:MAG: NTP transferase domain-containing protein [Anaerolineae bacterium]|nr:NTP transferase domain-containing protein [Anaerolineae bacterium]